MEVMSYKYSQNKLKAKKMFQKKKLFKRSKKEKIYIFLILTIDS